MGKIRVKELGEEEAEKKQKEETKKRKEAKKQEKSASSQDVIEKDSIAPLQNDKREIATSSAERGPDNDKKKEKKGKKEKFKKTKSSRSKKYSEMKAKTDPTKRYSLKEALELLPQIHIAKFDESVELHVNTEGPTSGTVTLPHGTGKKLRIAIADDEVIKNIEKGTIDFDILLANPSVMPKLAKVARILGPKGLMPNPKNGTITQNPEEAAKKYESGHMSYKTEAKTPIIHMTVGKLSFGQEKLAENIQIVFGALKSAKVNKIVLKSTMSPGIKLELS